MPVVGLIGNPNCGKSTLFNALTGANQRIGNWAGVTVEKKTGTFSLAEQSFEVIDLPGLYGVEADDGGSGEDERIVREFLRQNEADLLVNVVDASSLARGLFLTTQLLQRDIPVVVVLSMMDAAERARIDIDVEELSKSLDCDVIPVVATRGQGIAELKHTIGITAPSVVPEATTHSAEQLSHLDRYHRVDQVVTSAVTTAEHGRSITALLDKVVLNKYLAYPVFLGVMYLMFMFTINVGSAFIDFFDMVGDAFFVSGVRYVLELVSLPGWIVTFLADGVGGGVQLVMTFIPVIACLFLFLSFIEDSGYMARVAFILDRVMQSLGLHGKSFVPLIVGFGCNVPSVMATRTLENKPDRIMTTIMAPYMSCGARLTVYALFAAAFFPSNGQNVVFLLYLMGIAIAVGSAWLVRRHLLPVTESSFTFELPTYHLPTVRALVFHTWHRLKSFVLRAGKAIVLVVIVLNVVNSLGTDGSFGNENSEKSALSAIGRTITPIFHPMGIDSDNWPATVGIFTGMFAKEVVVGTLDALYSPATDDTGEYDLSGQLWDAVKTIPDNLGGIGETVGDPLGIGVGDVSDVATVSTDQGVELNTVRAMQSLFHGDLGAFSYLVFILLYMPCVATIGVIYKELGSFWAVFSTVWSVGVAYSAAVLCYQLGMAFQQPWEALFWCVLVSTFVVLLFAALVLWGKQNVRRDPDLIPLNQLD